MVNFTLNDLNELLSELPVMTPPNRGLGELCDPPRALAFVSDGADDFGRIAFFIEDFGLRAEAYYDASEADLRRALEFCNRWNATAAFPRVYVDEDGDFKLDAFLPLLGDGEFDRTYVKEKFLRLFTALVVEFCKRVLREFNLE